MMKSLESDPTPPCVVGAQKSAKKQVRMAPEQRVQQLLGCALHVFVTSGYQGSTMEDIARAAGVTRPIVYNHFKSKEGAYRACMAMARERLDQSIARHADLSEDPAARLRGGIAGYFAFLEDEPECWRLLYASGKAVAGPSAGYVQSLRFETVRKIAGLFEPFVDPQAYPKVLLVAHALSGAGEQLGKYWLANPEVPKSEIVEAMFNLMWNGLRDLGAGTH